MDIQAILFDKDGTLFDFNKTWGCWFSNILNDLSKNDSKLRKEIAAVFKFDQSNETFFKNSPFIAESNSFLITEISPLLPNWEKYDLLEWFNKKGLEAVTVPVKGLKTSLLKLKKMNLILGVSTNDTEEGANHQLNDYNLLDFFSFIAGSNSGFGTKPSPGMQNQFCKLTGIKPENILMVGDSLTDIKAGKNANMQTIGVLSGPATKEDLVNDADFVLNTISDLPELIKKINNN